MAQEKMGKKTVATNINNKTVRKLKQKKQHIVVVANLTPLNSKANHFFFKILCPVKLLRQSSMNKM